MTNGPDKEAEARAPESLCVQTRTHRVDALTAGAQTEAQETAITIFLRGGPSVRYLPHPLPPGQCQPQGH